MTSWTNICRKEELAPNAGVCAQFDQQQVAIFYCQRQQSLYAVSNYDPIGEANVISRGIMGSIDDHTYVSSPLYKQHFHLKTGVCLENPEHKLTIYPVRIMDDYIQLKKAS
ncbi:MAG: nitrite reductase small subunit NirD [Aliivibrio sp.]|uniref:nitrite reductase small subunit NirD n=1 Tax=Aliivibrio sp. TaxID=1872443 RepID=UPI001A511415|nr:nitrite reductase small subunit NirD [Aliivibrio sp.]